tara:strand:+ start:329 stop:676 length:348 start_codon:yes stop_codon:yes gene_type:complete
MEVGAPPELMLHKKTIKGRDHVVGFTPPQGPSQIYRNEERMNKSQYRDIKVGNKFYYHFKEQDPNWRPWYQNVEEDASVLLIIRHTHETYTKHNYQFQKCDKIDGEMYMILIEES